MPTVEFDLEDLESLLTIKLPRKEDELNEILAYVKGEVKQINDKEAHVEFKDSNRADLWSIEGFSRALKGILNIEKGLKDYKVVGDSRVEIHVDLRLKEIRPYIACSVVKGVNLTDAAIRQIMRFQDKLDETYGRGRRRTSIGLYNFDFITPPLKYAVSKPEKTRFVPLEFEEELTLEEILDRHPKGLKYAHLVRPYPVWPIFMDSAGKVLSFPPIINSNDLGRITEGTVNILVEVTGTSHKTVLDILKNVTLALADRGGKIYSTKIHYPYEDMSVEVTPNLETERFKIKVDYVKSILGLDLAPLEIKDLLERFRYGISKVSRSYLTVEVPCYRVDVLHQIDIVEDVAIAYDYNKVQTRWPQLPTVGGLSEKTKFRDLAKEIMIGLGFQEVLTYSMTNPDVLFTKMNLKPEKVVEIANPKHTFMTCLRNWLLPSLMEFLSHNIHVEYPQKIFEIGSCVIHDEKQENKILELDKVAAVTIHSNAGFTEAKSMLDAFLTDLGICYDIEACHHDSFIDGRTGKMLVADEVIGIIGEIHPQVLRNWNLENPAAAFEVDLDKLRVYLKKRGRNP